uniref:Twist-related protein 1-like n=1 Tax=Saccoglossus kowalevskii TaxID=10224 RepID=A0ABM0LYA1_SACKO|nr:PREDICTED: twist-related protein 1-like [Saccoglossus kowalevskii]
MLSTITEWKTVELSTTKKRDRRRPKNNGLLLRQTKGGGSKYSLSSESDPSSPQQFNEEVKISGKPPTVKCMEFVNVPSENEPAQSNSKRKTRAVEARHLANIKEKARVKDFNERLNKLRDVLPKICKPYGSKQLSKINTLKAAIDYIRYLRDVLEFGVENCDRRRNRKYEKHLRDICVRPTTDNLHVAKSLPKPMPERLNV